MNTRSKNVVVGLMAGVLMLSAGPALARDARHGFHQHHGRRNWHNAGDRADIRSDRRDIFSDRADLRRDFRDVRQDRRQLRWDLRHGASPARIASERADIRRDLGDIRSIERTCAGTTGTCGKTEEI